MISGLSSNPDGIDLEHVPTVPELCARGMARVVAWTQGNNPTPTHYQLHPAGQALIYETQKRNAAKLKAQARP
jgi:hypothetical protein